MPTYKSGPPTEEDVDGGCNNLNMSALAISPRGLIT